MVFLDRFHCNRQILIEYMAHSKMAARLKLHMYTLFCPVFLLGGVAYCSCSIELVKDPHKREPYREMAEYMVEK